MDNRKIISPIYKPRKTKLKDNNNIDSRLLEEFNKTRVTDKKALRDYFKLKRRVVRMYQNNKDNRLTTIQTQLEKKGIFINIAKIGKFISEYALKYVTKDGILKKR